MCFAIQIRRVIIGPNNIGRPIVMNSVICWGWEEGELYVLPHVLEFKRSIKNMYELH